MNPKQEFKRDSFTEKLIKYEQYPVGVIAIYSVNYLGRVIDHEVLNLRLVPYPLLNNGHSEGQMYLRYPSNEEFGKYGWSFQEYENALNKFNELMHSVP